jgi:hypothetical protein
VTLHNNEQRVYVHNAQHRKQQNHFHKPQSKGKQKMEEKEEAKLVFVAQWTVQEREISLFHNTKLFLHSGGKTEGLTKFKSPLYDILYAVNIIHMFRDTIQLNLQGVETPNSSCFLPKFLKPFVSKQQKMQKQIALFGRVDTHNLDEGEVKEMRWGIYDTPSKEETSVEVNADDRVARDFIRLCPRSDTAHMVVRVNSKGKSVSKPAPDHYAMTSFLKGFHPTVVRAAEGGGGGTVVQVTLHHVSILDNSVILDANTCAITLVSARQSSVTDNWLGSVISKACGHSMLVWEGIEGDSRHVLRYLHATQNPRHRLPTLGSAQAQLEVIERTAQQPLDLLHGPTWPRPRVLGDDMLDFVRTFEKVPVEFSIFGLKREQSCLTWASKIASKAGIIFGSSRRTPIEKIHQLKHSPFYQIPDDVDRARLLVGAPLGATRARINISPVNIPFFGVEWLDDISYAIKRSNVCLSPVVREKGDEDLWYQYWEKNGLEKKVEL